MARSPPEQSPKTLIFLARALTKDAVRGMGSRALVIFQGFRRFQDAIKALTSSVDHLAQLHEGMGPALDRLEALERSRAFWESECEGMMLKADGKLKAAASAEARERQLKKANERLADPFHEGGDGEAREAAHVLADDVETGEAEGVRPVRLALATNNKAHAVRFKFGLS